MKINTKETCCQSLDIVEVKKLLTSIMHNTRYFQENINQENAVFIARLI